MIEKCLEMAAQYDISVNKAIRGRGAVILDTTKGLKKIYEYSGTEGRLKYEFELLNYLKDKGFENVDNIVKTSEGQLFARDEFETMYVMKDWFAGKDCNAKSEADVLKGAEALAVLHNITESVNQVAELAIDIEDPLTEYERHNAELKRVKNYIRGKKKKAEFEYDILRHFDEYYLYATEATNALKKTAVSYLIDNAKKNTTICHGNYNYHNIMFVCDKTAVTGFERSGVGLPVKDLYFYLRKIMEKHDWNLKLGYNILERYNKIHRISGEENEILRIMVMYPEKFWKVVNQYYNSNKSWIPDKNVEKLNAVYKGQVKKEEFISKMWAL